MLAKMADSEFSVPDGAVGVWRLWLLRSNRPGILASMLITHGGPVSHVPTICARVIVVMLATLLSTACAAPLIAAVEKGDVEKTRQLLDQGADVGQTTYGLNRWTPLHVAAWKGHAEVARLLIHRGANINAKGYQGFTPLLVAQRYSHQDVIAVILEETDHAARALRLAAPTQPPDAAEQNSSSQEPVSLHVSALVMELKAIGAVPTHVPFLVTRILLSELDDVEGLRTVSPDDIQLMLSVEKQKDALGCDDVKCIAETGGALGVDLVISGEIGIMGSQYNLSLTAIDSKRSMAVGRVSVLVAANEDALADSIPSAVASLVAKIARSQEDATRP